MAESPSRRAGGLLVCTLLALLPLSAGAEEGAPLADFRRVELRVSADFIADCQTRSTQVTCKVSEVPREFSQLMFGLRGGTLAGVELLPKPDGTAQVRFSLKRTELRFQDGMLDGPRRWVIEIGLPAILIAPVQEQLPFRPYRVRTADLGLALPPANVQPLPMRGEPERRYQTCYAAFVEQRYDDAVEQCARVDPEHADSSAARMARKITAEAWVERASPNSTDDLPAISQALAAAESDATDPVEKVRYALLAAQVLEKLGYLNRAELHLDTRRPAYEGTPAEPYLLAGRARMLMMVGDFESARRLLEQLRALPGTSPTIGSALIALAGIAYEEGAAVVSVGLFDAAVERWPTLVASDPAALFQSAELYMMYGRVPEAQRNYERFLELAPEAAPFWVAQVRLAEILSHSDPVAGRERFQALAGSLPITEGQDLAFLRLAELVESANERRRMIRKMLRGKHSDYVLEELTIRAMQQGLDDGRVDDALRVARQYWRGEGDVRLLRLAPVLFDRVLYLATRRAALADTPLDVLKLYYADRARFEGHILRGEIHLLVGQALRKLDMHEEALRVLQSGLGGDAESREPDAAARLYREIAAVLWESGDRFRLGESLDYLDARYPKRFDDYDYWMARAHRAWWDGRLDEARKIFLFALNGPIADVQRLLLMEKLADVCEAMGDFDRAIRALGMRIAEHDRLGRDRTDLGRRDARWRIAEIELRRGRHAQAAGALGVFLDEYPDDPERYEARFLLARSLLALGDEEAAKRGWDIVSKEDADGVFGHLAARELEMMRWRRLHLEPARARVGL